MTNRSEKKFAWDICRKNAGRGSVYRGRPRGSQQGTSNFNVKLSIKLQTLARFLNLQNIFAFLVASVFYCFSQVAADDKKYVSLRQEAVPFDLFELQELIVNGYRQEMIEVGLVDSLSAIGISPVHAVQKDFDLRPKRESQRSGVVFAAGSRQHVDFGYVEDSLRSYRWLLLTIKLETPTEPDSKATILSVNEDELAGGRNPRVAFNTETGLTVEWRGLGPNGSKTYKLASQNVIADGKTWNVVLAYRRHGRLFLDVNGQEQQVVSDTLSFSAPPARNEASSFVGDPQRNTLGWAFDTIIFGQTELSEALADKIVGWAAARVGASYLLPEGHPYRSKLPLRDTGDTHRRYFHDPEAWAGAWSAKSKEKRTSNQGKLLPSDEGYIRVFIDDFRENSVIRSDASEGGENAIWFAPGWNGGVGKDAMLRNLEKSSNVYEHDPENDTLTLSIAYDKGWQGAAIYSVNDAGLGRSWEGGGIFRIHAKFPALEENPDVGYFPAFLWFYNLEHLFWRTSERIEIDGFEFEGNDDHWINGGSAHVHAGQYPGKFGHLERDIPHKKMLAAHLDFDVWDGEFHLWELRIDPDFTYLGVDGRELARIVTPDEFLERIYMIADYALRLEHGEPDRSIRHDMVLDYVEVLQSQDMVDRLPKAFSARPVVTGEKAIEKTLNCGAEMKHATADIWYFWYSNGYPRGFSPSPTYRVTASDAGTKLRCMMKLVGQNNQPEAWSEQVEIDG